MAIFRTHLDIGNLLRGGVRTSASACAVFLLLSVASGSVRAEGGPSSSPNQVAKSDAGPATTPAMLPILDSESRQRALRLIQDVFGSDLRTPSEPSEQLALARRLLKAGVNEQKDLAVRYVLLTLASEKAASAGNAEVAFAAVDEAAASFQVDALKLKADSALTIGRSLTLAKDRADFIEKVQPLIGQCVEFDRYDLAKQVAELSLATARNLDVRQARSASAHLQQVHEAQTSYEQAVAAAAVLKRTPLDPEANLRAGKFQCFVKGDWQQGLPMLARSHDEPLKVLALRELSGADSSEKQIALGDGWWDQGQRLSGIAKDACMKHAASIYLPALASLDQGLLREKLERRIQAIADGTPADAPLAANKMSSRGIASTLEALSVPGALKLVRSWDKIRPKTTIGAQRIEGSAVLKRQNSPYLITGLLHIAPAATLSIEPGTIVLLAPQVQIEVEGSLTATSDGPWIVLANADAAQKWAGVDCQVSGKVNLRRCVLAGASRAVYGHDNRGTFSANQCLFAECGETVSFENGGHGTVQNSLFLQNESGPLGFGDRSSVRILRCLLMGNQRGCSASGWGSCDVSNSTFVSNDTAAVGSDRGDNVHISLCNIIPGTGKALDSGGGKIIARGNFWGTAGPPADAACDCTGPAQGALENAMPTLPLCEFLTTSPATVTQVGAARADKTPPAPQQPFVPVEATVGGWLMASNEYVFALLPDGRVVAGGRESSGRWHLTTAAVVIHFDDGVHVYTYDQRTGDDKLAGKDQDGHDIGMTRMLVVPSDAAPFLPLNSLAGTWAEGNGTKFVLAPNGLLAYDGKPVGFWQDKADAVVLRFTNGRIDSYTNLTGNKLTGTSSIGHAVVITKQPGR